MRIANPGSAGILAGVVFLTPARMPALPGFEPPTLAFGWGKPPIGSVAYTRDRA